MDNDVELMLPPVPGKEEAHPAFFINHGAAKLMIAFPRVGDGCQNTSTIWMDGCGTIEGYPRQPFSWTAAHAIANLWRSDHNEWAHKEGCGGSDSKAGRAFNQYIYWNCIANGSRDYDRKKIVEYSRGVFDDK